MAEEKPSLSIPVNSGNDIDSLLEILIPGKKQTILIVDDSEIEMDYLKTILSEDYIPLFASDGESGLDIAKNGAPDLILLDVLMPGMNGFDVCARLKADKHTQDIPVIFITSLHEEVDETHGLEIGAVDYIRKPFNPLIVKIRVKNQLELKIHRDQLESLVVLRTIKLAESNNRLKALDAARHDYLCAISQELRTPAHGVLCIADMALWAINDKKLQSEYFTLFNHARNQLLNTLDNALQLAELEEGWKNIDKTKEVELNKAIDQSLQFLGQGFSSRKLQLVPHLSGNTQIHGNEAIIGRIITTMLQIVEKMATPWSTVHVTTEEKQNTVTLFIQFRCWPISEKLQKTFFDIFSYDRICSPVAELGLAIPLAAGQIHLLEGTIDIHNTKYGVEIDLEFKK